MDPEVGARVREAPGREWGFVLAATARITRDLDAAEDCVQDAYAQALAAWPDSGVPARPAAWLTVVARRRAMNLIRRSDTLTRKLPLLVGTDTTPGPGDDDTAADPIPDDRLRLIFTSCHPAPAAAPPGAPTLPLRPRPPPRAGPRPLPPPPHPRPHPRPPADGRLPLLAEQDRPRWDRAEINEGLALIRTALEQRTPPRYALMAAIAAVHAAAPRWESTDWQQITDLYDTLTQIWPSPVVALNRAIAIGEARGPHAGLAALDQLATEPQLAGYHYLPAARAEFLRRLRRADDARLAYHEALLLTDNPIERDFLTRRLGELDR